jgi:hypothetical protein
MTVAAPRPITASGVSSEIYWPSGTTVGQIVTRSG